MSNNVDKLQNCIDGIYSCNINPRNGLPEELFLLVSSIVPIPNVDLLVRDKKGMVLLSWRDDKFYGKGWHIPGGCIRFGEHMIDRLTETAAIEFGIGISFDPEPLAVRDVLRPPQNGLTHPDQRGHNITILFNCWFPEGYHIDNKGIYENDAGFLKWFEKIPNNILKVHYVYNDVFKKLNLL